MAAYPVIVRRRKRRRYRSVRNNCSIEVRLTLESALAKSARSLAGLGREQPRQGQREVRRAVGITLHQAPPPERVLADELAALGLVARLLVNRHCDHLPLP